MREGCPCGFFTHPPNFFRSDSGQWRLFPVSRQTSPLPYPTTRNPDPLAMKHRSTIKARSTAFSFLGTAPDRRAKNRDLRFPFSPTSTKFSLFASYRTMTATPAFATIRRCFFPALALPALLAAAPVLRGEEAPPLDAERTRAALGIRHRNPVKSSSPIVKRTYERRPAKGLDVEAGAAAAGADAGDLVDVEIVHREDGSTEVHPFVALPILFVVNSDQLFDDTSRRNVEVMAGVLRELSSHGPAHFAVQGHTSAEGARDSNQALSQRRAARIEALLAAKGVEAKTLSVVGLGEDAARFPEHAPEPQRQEDRRVLIVRMR